MSPGELALGFALVGLAVLWVWALWPRKPEPASFGVKEYSFEIPKHPTNPNATARSVTLYVRDER